MSGRLSGKVAVVTGAGTKAPGVGIGCAIAQVLARDGASVLVVDRDEDNAQTTSRMIEAEGGRAAIQLADVSDESDCAAMITAAVDTFGGLDILVNNAAVSIHVPITETSQELFDSIVSINLRGPFMASKHAIPALIARGGGSIVNIGSIAGIRDSGSTHPVYCATKGGVLGLTGDLAGEYGEHNIRVNAVLPGMIESPMQSSVAPLPSEAMQQSNMLGRQGSVWDVAHAVAFLCTDDASYITGHVLPVDGGATQKLPVAGAARAAIRARG